MWVKSNRSKWKILSYIFLYLFKMIKFLSSYTSAGLLYWLFSMFFRQTLNYSNCDSFLSASLLENIYIAHLLLIILLCTTWKSEWIWKLFNFYSFIMGFYLIILISCIILFALYHNLAFTIIIFWSWLLMIFAAIPLILNRNFI